MTLWNSVTLDQIVGPLNTGLSFIQPGYEAFAFEFTVKNTSNANVHEDIFSDLQVFDAHGQGFTGDISGDYTGGPPFPTGLIVISPGGSATGWVVAQIPVGDTLTKVDFTPGGYTFGGNPDVWAVSQPSAGAPTTTGVPDHTIVYDVTGDSDNVLLTYTATGGNTSQASDSTLPQTLTEHLNSGSYFSMIVAAQGSGTSVTCTVLDDGHQISTNTGTGPFGSADCNGTVP